MPSETGPAVRRLDDWDADRLRGIAGEYGTPLYVVDPERVRENLRRFRNAFPAAGIRYASKANAGPAVLSTAADEGAGVEVASPGELRRVRAAGFDPERILYTAVNPPAADLDALVEFWHDAPELTVTAGAVDTLDRLAERGFDGRLALRVNPGVGAGHDEAVHIGADPQFGVPGDRAVEVARRAADRFDLVGVHAHVGSGILDDDLDRYRAAVERLGNLAGRIDGAVDGGLEFVDAGGGLGVPYRPDRDPLALDAAADVVREALSGVDADLRLEPGRYLVADAGVLLTRVNTRKETPGTVVAGVDASLATLVRPAMFDAYHPIRNLSADGGDPAGGASGSGEDRPTEEVTVGGPVCSGADTFCSDRSLARPERGDVLAIGMAGSYGYELASRFHCRPLPGEVALRDGDVTVSRRAESIEDVESVLPSDGDPGA
ncbi:diaminopimelate decarboxylase [Halobacteriales archaeon QS_8_69_26]|nr:MAG: diaminopimelate decarboxylase [Halobacteriales archaeon QS_8_69_26]